MRLNDFSCRIPEGQETHSGYVEMKHGKQYSIQLRNDRDVPCDARVSVDGKEIGVWRIYAKSGMLLERPAEDHGRFTFYELGTDEAVKAKLHSVPAGMLGLVQVLFTPMANWTMTVSYPPYYVTNQPWTPVEWRQAPTITCRESSMGSTTNAGQFTNTITAMNCCSTPTSAGGTGLSGHSQQEFAPVGELILDHSQATTITLRLIVRQSSGARELHPIQNANPVPPPVEPWEPINDFSREFVGRGRKPYGR